MPDHTLGRWLLVVLAIIGLAVAMPPVSAHGDAPTPTETAAEERPADNETVDVHAAHHAGTETVEWMDAHMGALADEMVPHASDRGHDETRHDDAMHDDPNHDDRNHDETGHDDRNHDHASHDRQHGC